MNTSPLERQLNLIIALLNTPRYLTAEEINRSVQGYNSQGEAFRQMFERDKRALVRLGVPIKVGRSEENPTIDGYRIFDSEYVLPSVVFTAEELTVLSLASELFRDDSYSDTQRGLDKLEHSLESSQLLTSPIALPASLSAVEQANLSTLTEAAAEASVVTFHYHTAHDVTEYERRVEPWGVVSNDGRWYCVGFDIDRDAIRVYRISRISSQVTNTGKKATHERSAQPAREILRQQLSQVRQYISATIRVLPESCMVLRSAATSCEERSEYSDLTFTNISYQWLRQAVLAEGPVAWVVEPSALKDDIISVLHNMVEQTQETDATARGE